MMQKVDFFKDGGGASLKIWTFLSQIGVKLAAFSLILPLNFLGEGGYGPAVIVHIFTHLTGTCICINLRIRKSHTGYCIQIYFRHSRWR